MDPYSLRYVQGSRARHGHVLRHQVALRSREEGEGEGEARSATRGRQGGRSLRAIAPGPSARHLRPCQEARFELDLPMMAKNSRPISSDTAAIARCGYWAASAGESELASAHRESCRRWMAGLGLFALVCMEGFSQYRHVLMVWGAITKQFKVKH